MNTRTHWSRIIRLNPDGMTVGELEWRESPGRTFELHLDVAPSHQRQGIGRDLIQQLEEKVKDLEPMSLYTFMAADNRQAKRFFAAVGFKLIEVLGFYGEDRPAVMGIKTIGRPL